MTHEQAKKIVEKIIVDLKYRQGLRQEWDCVDGQVKGEIKKSWIKIVMEGSK